MQIAAQVLLAGGVVFVLFRLGSLWRNSHVAWSAVRWLPLVGALLIAIAAVAAAALTWNRILRALGVETRPRWAGVFLQAQLAKYVPGGVWQYAGRVALSRSEDIPVKAVTMSLPIELAGTVLAGGLLALLAAGPWGLAAAGLALVSVFALSVSGSAEKAIAAAQRWFGDRDVGAVPRGIVASFIPYVAITALLGVTLWLVADALFGVPAGDLPFYVGAFSIAWLTGLVAVFAPGGLGVREAILVALLRGRLGTADAVVLATVSRAVLTIADLLGACAGVLILRRGSGLRPGTRLRAHRG
ncbi:MAG: lysylphosphatidylglycerol synthase domain-containing protein [Actinomycetota bacterium]|nr:lysylphosphatidylglycerol synthase domain-containing protein [Actinomycetota bacterium]